MSILERIRSKAGVAIGLVGLALVLFVVQDALNNNYGIFGGNPNSTDVGEIDGERISIKEFEARVEDNANRYKMQTQQNNIDQNTMDMMRDQTWNSLVQENIYVKEFDELGIKVTNEELFDLVQGEDPHPQIKSAPVFQNPQTGQFDRTLVIRYLKNMEASDDAQAKSQWLSFEEGMLKEAEAKKYSSLFKKGVYVTGLEAKSIYNNRMRTADAELVALNYFTVADSTIATEDSDLKAYFKKNYDKYKEKDNARKLDFIVFDVIPTAEDTAAIQKWVNEQTAEFAKSTNDTLFVDLNSETKFDTLAHPRSFYPEEIQARLFSDSVGTVIGPIYKDGKYKIYKIAGVKRDSLYQMRASHILFKTEGPTKEDTLNTMKKAQEVLAEIRKGADFGEKAAQYGTDGTSSRGGDLGWFTEGQMVKEFNDYVKKGKKGDIGIVKTQFGIHIVKVTENKTNMAVAVGMLDRSITASEGTRNLAYNSASQFAAAATDADGFDKYVAEKGLTKRNAEVRETEKYLAGMPDAREVIRWSFNAKKGDVSEVFSINDKFVVAVLTGTKEKGKADFDMSKERVIADYRKEKKAEMLLEKAKTALSGATSMQAVAEKLQVAVTPITSQTFENSNISYVGPDNTFVGTMFGTKTTGKILGPVKGDNAVYIYNITKYNEPAPITDLSPFRSEAQQALSSRSENAAFEALKELMDVKDNRYRFY